MSYQTVGDLIRARFNAGAQASHPAVPRYMPNETPDPDIAELWWALDINDGDSFQISVSPTMWRRLGVVTVSAFAPRNDGANALRALMESAQSMFEGLDFLTSDGLKVVFVGTESVPAGGNDRFFQTNINHEFHYDDAS